MDDSKPPCFRYLDRYPPIRVRLLAKQSGSSRRKEDDLAICHAELAISSGLPLARILAISQMVDSWLGVTIGEYLAFCGACHFNPLVLRDRKRVEDYEYRCLKRNQRPFQWLTKSPHYETEFRPLIERLSAANSRRQHVA